MSELRLTAIRDPASTLPRPQEVVDVVKVVIRDWKGAKDG